MNPRILGVALAGLVLMPLSGCSRLPPGAAPATDTAGEPPAMSTPYADPEMTVVPIGIRIPSIGVNSHDPWVPEGLDDKNQIKVPDLRHPEQVGWYCPMATTEDPNPVDCGAPEPGRVGSSVVLGHINGNGKWGVFAKLSQVKVGATVEIDRADGRTAVFRITKSEIVDKTAFPTGTVYNDLDYPGIRLISCGGKLIKAEHRYAGQVILFGDLVDMRITHP